MATIPKIYVDSFSSAQNGMDSSVVPTDIQKNQTAFNLNCSIRNGYLHPRPPFQKKSLNFNGDSGLQTVFETGLFQSMGYYRPDLGTESLIFQIGGHLITATESDGVWNIADVSISGDLNSSSPLIAWMWQAEKWMIVNDGTGVLPIFFDGIASRRSAGDSIIVGFVDKTTPPVPAAPPPVGGLVTVTLTTAFSGEYNVPVLFNGEFYQTLIPGTPVSPVYSAQLTNLTDSGSTILDGTNVFITENLYQTVAILRTGTFGSKLTAAAGTIPINLTLNGPAPAALAIGSKVSITSSGAAVVCPATTVWKVTGKSGNVLSLKNNDPMSSTGAGYSFYYPPGTAVLNPSPSSNVLIGAISNGGDITTPPIGSFVTTDLTALYTGLPGGIVQIGSAYYSIQSTYSPPPSSGTTLLLKNLTDTSTANYVLSNTNIDYPNNALIMSVPELPAGKMGVYGMERNSICLTDGLSYVMGDLVGGASGTPAYNYRDSVLKTTENIDLPGGGSFRLPGAGDQITAMMYAPVLDTSLGQGALQVFTSVSCHSNNTSINRSTWENPTSPLQTKSLDGEAALAQDSSFLVNSDIFFRSTIGLGSLVLARRDFGRWGNIPISAEMQRPLDSDDQSLLPFGSGKTFDNRTLSTCHPVQGPTGVVHLGLVSLNLQLISSLRSQLPPAWEGVWTGLNILKVITGRINGVLRMFALTYNAISGVNELHEFLPEKTNEYLDNGDTGIVWQSELPVLFNKDIKPREEICELNDGEVYLSGIKGDVHVQVYYRPDYYPCWTLWNEFDVCASDQAGKRRGYRMRIGLGTPSAIPVEAGNNRPLRLGYFFQFRIVVTGSCTFNDLKVKAVAQPIPEYARMIVGDEDCQVIDCAEVDDFNQYTTQGSV